MSNFSGLISKPKPALTAMDRCDRCGAQALVQVLFVTAGSELLFCNHHFVKHADAIGAQAGLVVTDDRGLLEK